MKPRIVVPIIIVVAVAGAVGYVVLGAQAARSRLRRLLDEVRLPLEPGKDAAPKEETVAAIVGEHREQLLDVVRAGDPADAAAAIRALEAWLAGKGPQDDAGRRFLGDALDASAVVVEANPTDALLGGIADRVAGSLLLEAGAKGEFADRCFARRAGSARAPRRIVGVELEDGEVDLAWEIHPEATYYQVAVSAARGHPYEVAPDVARDIERTLMSMTVTSNQTSFRDLLEKSPAFTSVEEAKAIVEQAIESGGYLIVWVLAFKGDPSDFQVTNVLDETHARFALRVSY